MSTLSALDPASVWREAGKLRMPPSIRPRRRRHESRAVSSAEEHLFFRGRSCGCLQTLVIHSKPNQKLLKLACIGGLGHMDIEALFGGRLPACVIGMTCNRHKGRCGKALETPIHRL
jgi:hypothetical protein